MNAIAPKSRRDFLADVGKGMLVGALGADLACGLGLSSAHAAEDAALDFGELEPLVAFMQETPLNKLVGACVEKIRAGAELKQLVAAAALANARTFGGEDYIGFHTIMALMPAYQMSKELAGASAALPVLKVLYRNTSRIQAFGGRKSEVLKALAAQTAATEAKPLADGVHEKNMAQAEQSFAALTGRSADEAFNELLHIVMESPEVHRVNLHYRSWDLLDIVGKERALTMLRQSVHYCVKGENWASQGNKEPRTLLPQLLEKHGLLDKKPGTREADDAFVDKMMQTFFTSTPQQAAEAAAMALAEGMNPAAIGEAISLTANQLVLRDWGRPPAQEAPGKPAGSVHGDSIGVHASDSANAWRNLARVSNARNTFACLIIGAYQVARDKGDRGGDFQKWKPLPYSNHTSNSKDAATLLREAEEAIRGNLQARAASTIARYGELGHPERAAFDLLLKYAVSEDGALHAEKYYRTCSDDFNSTRAAFRWRHLTSLARVTASEYGRPAAGVAEAKEMLKV